MKDGRKLVLVSGLDGVGKSTLCKKFSERLDGVVIPLAKSLRAELSIICPDMDFYVKPTPENVRASMISYGTAKRLENQNYFIERWLEYAAEYRSDKILLCDDMRYPNELEYFTDNFNCYHIHIRRQETPQELQNLSSYHYFQNPYFGIRADVEITPVAQKYPDDNISELLLYMVINDLLMLA